MNYGSEPVLTQQLYRWLDHACGQHFVQLGWPHQLSTAPDHICTYVNIQVCTAQMQGLHLQTIYWQATQLYQLMCTTVFILLLISSPYAASSKRCGTYHIGVPMCH